MILTQSIAFDLVLLAAAPAIGLGAIYALLTWRWQPKRRNLVPTRTLSPGEATLLERRWKAAGGAGVFSVPLPKGRIGYNFANPDSGPVVPYAADPKLIVNLRDGDKNRNRFLPLDLSPGSERTSASIQQRPRRFPDVPRNPRLTERR